MGGSDQKNLLITVQDVNEPIDGLTLSKDRVLENTTGGTFVGSTSRIRYANCRKFVPDWGRKQRIFTSC